MNKRKEKKITGSIARWNSVVCKSKTQVCVSPWVLFEDISLPSDVCSSSPVAGYFFKLLEKYGKDMSSLEDYSLVQVAPGWLCVVLDDDITEPAHKLWAQVWKDGGDLFYQQRSTWKLVTDDSDVKSESVDYASVSMFLKSDELVDPTVVFPSGSAYLSALVYDGSMSFKQYREAYRKYGLDTMEIQSLSIRHVAPGVVTVVRNVDLSDFSLAYALLSDAYDESILEFPVKLLLRQEMVRKGGEYQEGMCYLRMIRPECRLFVQVALGAYPTVSSLKKFSHMFVSHMTNDCELTGHDMVHVGSAGVLSGFERMPEHIVVGGRASVPMCKRVNVETPGLDSSEASVSAYLQSIAVGTRQAVVVHALHDQYVVGGAEKFNGFGLIDCKPVGLTSDLYQSYTFCTSLSKRSLLLLPPGCSIVCKDTRVQSSEYPVCVVLPSGFFCRVDVKSEVTKHQVKQLLGPGVAWSTRVDELYAAVDPLKLWCLPLDGVLHDVWESSEFRKDRYCYDLRFASRSAGMYVDYIPEVEHYSSGKFVEVSDPLDSWKSVYEVRYESTFHSEGDAVGIGMMKGRDSCMVIQGFRTTSSKGRLKLSSCVELLNSDAVVAINRYGCGSLVTPHKVKLGDEYSFHVSTIADEYCFDNESTSDNEDLC